MTVLSITKIIYVAIAFGLLFLQYKLCKSANGKKAGLILPIVSFILSVISAVNVFLFSFEKTSSTAETYDDEGKVISSEVVIEEESDIASVLPGVFATLIYANMPTVAYIIIYTSVASKKKKSELEAAEMAKTQIQDL